MEQECWARAERREGAELGRALNAGRALDAWAGSGLDTGFGFLSFLFLSQTHSKLFEFKHKFEFKP